MIIKYLNQLNIYLCLKLTNHLRLKIWSYAENYMQQLVNATKLWLVSEISAKSDTL